MRFHSRADSEETIACLFQSSDSGQPENSGTRSAGTSPFLNYYVAAFREAHSSTLCRESGRGPRARNHALSPFFYRPLRLVTLSCVSQCQFSPRVDLARPQITRFLRVLERNRAATFAATTSSRNCLEDFLASSRLANVVKRQESPRSYLILTEIVTISR